MGRKRCLSASECVKMSVTDSIVEDSIVNGKLDEGRTNNDSISYSEFVGCSVEQFECSDPSTSYATHESTWNLRGGIDQNKLGAPHQLEEVGEDGAEKRMTMGRLGLSYTPLKHTIVSGGPGVSEQVGLASLPSRHRVPETYEQLANLFTDDTLVVVRFKPTEYGIQAYLCKPGSVEDDHVCPDEMGRRKETVMAWLGRAGGWLLDLGFFPNDSLLEKLSSETRFVLLPWLGQENHQGGDEIEPDQLKPSPYERSSVRTPSSPDHDYSSRAHEGAVDDNFCFLLTSDKTYVVTSHPELLESSEMRTLMATQVSVVCQRIVREEPSKLNVADQLTCIATPETTYTAAYYRLASEHLNVLPKPTTPTKKRAKKHKLVVRLPCMRKYMKKL